MKVRQKYEARLVLRMSSSVAAYNYKFGSENDGAHVSAAKGLTLTTRLNAID